ncbi:MAG TPA: aspartate aminotransferase family protein [Candidatus Saccharimonadales bacterium]|nr:aspartate aminotransferase family protein [Candidatus Saccharimonadales bacterium]
MASGTRRSSSKQVIDLLRKFESRNVTYLDSEGGWPIVWAIAKGMHVFDAEGKRYLDLTGAFGVAAAGHANPRVVRAGQQQMSRLLHAMGDVHPHALKGLLCRELSRITFQRWSGGNSTAKTIFCNSGFEAVEAALKTAALATGKKDVIAFHGGYHGLGYGALNVTHREYFRSPFRAQLKEFGHFLPFPANTGGLPHLQKALEKLLARKKIGAVLVEPMQARGGINIPPFEFLPLLKAVCQKRGALLILDEIYTGFGRTGAWFACEQSRTIPDIICLGKALTGGFPLSACVGEARLMDTAWPTSPGEALHTSTFLGHPVGCAMALAQIQELEKNTKGPSLVRGASKKGKFLLAQLRTLSPPSGIRFEARGIGLMAGLELTFEDGKPATALALQVIKQMLHRGYILLPEGEHSNVISFTPPLTVSTAQLHNTCSALQLTIQECS